MREVKELDKFGGTICDCKFDPRYACTLEEDGFEGESTHFHKMCEKCGFTWGGNHCDHDGYQTACSVCGHRNTPIKDTWGEWYEERASATLEVWSKPIKGDSDLPPLMDTCPDCGSDYPFYADCSCRKESQAGD